MDGITITAAALISLVGCAVGVAGWLHNRDKTRGEDAAWRGSISAKLDNINANVSGLGKDVARIEQRVNGHAERLATVEASAKQAHRRIDRLDAQRSTGKEDAGE